MPNIRLQPKAALQPTSMTSTSSLPMPWRERANLTVTLNKAASKPKLEAATAGTASDFNGTVSFPDASTATVDMYKADGSKVYVK